jgi:hypothetical protein
LNLKKKLLSNVKIIDKLKDYAAFDDSKLLILSGRVKFMNLGFAFAASAAGK